MMRKILIIFVCLTVLGCGREEESLLEDAIIRYGEKKGSSTELLSRGLLRECSAGTFESEGLASEGNCLFYRNNDSIDLAAPFERSVDVLSAGEVMPACGESIFALGSASKIQIYDKEGLKKGLLAIDDVKDSIKAVAIKGGTLYYYRKHQIYRFSDTAESQQLVQDRFSPPYKKYYTVSLHVSGNVLGIVTGSPGYYYISAVKLVPERTLVTNITASSSKIHFEDDRVFYVYGGSGNWRVKEFSFNTKNKREIRKFRELQTIEFCDAGFIFKDANGLWVQDYSKQIIKVPFDYGISGKIAGKVLIADNNTVYPVDLGCFIKKLNELKFKLPDLFH